MRIKSAGLVGAVVLTLMLVLTPAHASACGGPWVGSGPQACGFNTALIVPSFVSGTVTAYHWGAVASVTLTIYLGIIPWATCSNTGGGVASCAIPPTPALPFSAYTCVVTGTYINGIYGCTD